MCPEHHHNSRDRGCAGQHSQPITRRRSVPAFHHRQRGIGLPAAIFVITLLTSIAVAINLLVSQNTGSFEEEVQLTRAFYAAESGAGFGVRTLFPADTYPATGSCAAPRTYEFAVPGLAGCRAEVSCTLDVTVDDIDYHLITSQGFCGDITRTVEVRTRITTGP